MGKITYEQLDRFRKQLRGDQLASDGTILREGKGTYNEEYSGGHVGIVKLKSGYALGIFSKEGQEGVLMTDVRYDNFYGDTGNGKVFLWTSFKDHQITDTMYKYFNHTINKKERVIPPVEKIITQLEEEINIRRWEKTKGYNVYVEEEEYREYDHESYHIVIDRPKPDYYEESFFITVFEDEVGYSVIWYLDQFDAQKDEGVEKVKDEKELYRNLYEKGI